MEEQEKFDYSLFEREAIEGLRSGKRFRARRVCQTQNNIIHEIISDDSAQCLVT